MIHPDIIEYLLPIFRALPQKGTKKIIRQAEGDSILVKKACKDYILLALKRKGKTSGYYFTGLGEAFFRTIEKEVSLKKEIEALNKELEQTRQKTTSLEEQILRLKEEAVPKTEKIFIENPAEKNVLATLKALNRNNWFQILNAVKDQEDNTKLRTVLMALSTCKPEKP